MDWKIDGDPWPQTTRRTADTQGGQVTWTTYPGNMTHREQVVLHDAGFYFAGERDAQVAAAALVDLWPKLRDAVLAEVARHAALEVPNVEHP